MKKLIIIMLTLLALSGLAAVELKYWTNAAYLQNIPRLYDDGDLLTRVSTVFTPPADCDVEGVYFPFYLAGAQAQANVLVQIWPVDAEGLPSMVGFPLATTTVMYADLIDWANAPVGEDFNYVDFSASNLNFGPTGTNGLAFAMVISTTNGVAGSIFTATLHDSANPPVGDSFNYYSEPAPAVWSRFYDYCFSAEVTYSGNQIDVAADNLTFTGDFFLAPAELITYEAGVKNNSVDAGGTPIAVTGVQVALALWGDGDDPLWSDLKTVDLAAGQTLSIEDFADCTLPATGGRYVLQLQAWHDDDITHGNDNLYLQQDVVELPTELAYDETDGSTTHGSSAHAFYDAGYGWANAFWYYGEPLKITEVSFDMRDNTWPVGALGNLSYAILPDDGTGQPDMANPLVPITAAACNLGAWNTYDVSSYNINIPAGETFYIAYFQVGEYEAGAPGLLGDTRTPISSWATSWAYYYDDDLAEWLWETPNAVDEDMCIRCSVELGVLGVEAPIVSIILDGYPSLEWEEVPGAPFYTVYGTDDPEAETPWTVIETNIQDLGYVYEGTETFKFFYVTASTTETGSRGMTLSPQVKAFEPVRLPVKSSEIVEKTIKTMNIAVPALRK